MEYGYQHYNAILQALFENNAAFPSEKHYENFIKDLLEILNI